MREKSPNLYSVEVHQSKRALQCLDGNRTVHRQNVSVVREELRCDRHQLGLMRARRVVQLLQLFFCQGDLYLLWGGFRGY